MDNSNAESNIEDQEEIVNNSNAESNIEDQEEIVNNRDEATNNELDTINEFEESKNSVII